MRQLFPRKDKRAECCEVAKQVTCVGNSGIFCAMIVSSPATAFPEISQSRYEVTDKNHDKLGSWVASGLFLGVPLAVRGQSVF